MTSDLIGYCTYNAILLSLLALKNALVVMTFWACKNLYIKRTSEINASLRKRCKPGKCMDTIVSANVMLDDSDNEETTTPPRRGKGKTEPDGNVLSTELAADCDLEEKIVATKREHEEPSDADMDLSLQSYRASQDELLGRGQKPSLTR